MCTGGNKISVPKPPAPQQATEALKEVSADAAASRDNTNRRLAARLSLQRTNATSPLGVTGAASTTQKTLLGE